jgi:hypothetical protein
MNRMEKAVQQLINRMIATVPVNIIYHRGTASTNIVCWIGTTAFRITDQGNSRLTWSDRDYMIPVASLKINGILIEPDYGDWIEETVFGTLRKFELMAPQGEQVWRHSDQQKMIYRIHTKEVNK